MNRHERRHQAKNSGRHKFIVTGEFLSYHDVIDLLEQSPAIAAILAPIITAMGGGQPPQCGGCGAALTAGAPPGGYVVLRHGGSGEELLSGICVACFAGDRAALQRRVATALGVEPLPVQHLHFERWGRA